MEIRIVQRFPCTPKRLIEILRDPGFERESREVAAIDVTPLQNQEQGGVLTERLRVTSRKELPSLLRSAVGADRLSYDQELITDTATLVTRWRILPLFQADKVTCSGTSRIVAAADGCERHITGELKVNVAFIGGRIEQGIVTELEEGYRKAAEVITRWACK